MSETRAGYIAVASALIIAAVVLIVVATVSLSSIFTRANVLQSHLKERSGALAKACVNVALLKLAQSSSYAGGETVAVGSDTCQIFAITTDAAGREIAAKGQYQNSVTNLKATVATSSVSIIGWQEL